MTSEDREFPPVVKEIEEKLPRTGKVIGWVDKTKLPPSLSEKLKPSKYQLGKKIYSTSSRIIPPTMFMSVFLPIIVRHEILHDALTITLGTALYSRGTVKEQEAEAGLSQHVQEVSEAILGNKNHKAFKGLVSHPEGPTHVLLTGRKVIFLKLPKRYKGKLYLPFFRRARIPIHK